MGYNPPASDVFWQRKNGITGPSRLESADRLHVFTFEHEPRKTTVILQNWGLTHVGPDAASGRHDIGE
jgi:hypothetical protein